VVVDGARFLPVSTTISRVVVSAWSSSGALLAGSCEAVARPATDSRFPTYSCNVALDAAHNASCFEDPTATLVLQVCVIVARVALSGQPVWSHLVQVASGAVRLSACMRHCCSCPPLPLLQVHTIEQTSRTLRVVGFALLPLFLDPTTGLQPLSHSTSDYVLNAGAFQVRGGGGAACALACWAGLSDVWLARVLQVPLHAGAPATNAPLRVSSLDGVPRVPCASLLVRIMTPGG
jgi:hypothetical protein